MEREWEIIVELSRESFADFQLLRIANGKAHVATGSASIVVYELLPG